MKFIILLILSLISISNAGENQWVTFNIENHTKKNLIISDSILTYGKWYKTACKLCELKTVNQVIKPDSFALVNSCGRLLSPTGAEGEFSIFDGYKNSTETNQILHVYFSVPFLLNSYNTLAISNFNDNLYSVQKIGGKLVKSSDLGIVHIKISDLM